MSKRVREKAASGDGEGAGRNRLNRGMWERLRDRKRREVQAWQVQRLYRHTFSFRLSRLCGNRGREQLGRE